MFYNENISTISSLIHLVKDDDDQNPEEMHLSKLKELYTRLCQSTQFKEGQFVTWKPGLKNRNFPAYGEAAIITKVMQESNYDPSENCASSPFFMEPLTLVIGQLIDNNFNEYHVDGRRIQLFKIQSVSQK